MKLTLPNYVTGRDTSVRWPAYQWQKPIPETQYDDCLHQDAVKWNLLVARGGLQTLCCPTGRNKYAQKPWIAMPKEGRRFKPIEYLAIADAVFDSSNQLVLEVYVPVGYDGVITDVVCGMTAPGATGFVEGSGDITWRISSNRRYLRDLGEIQSSLGSLVTPSPVPRGGLRVFSRNLIQFFVAFTPGAAGNLNPLGRIVCSITGWWYPR